MVKQYFILIVILSGISLSGYSQVVEQKIPDKTRILFLLDASGSMLAKFERNLLRMDVARRIMNDLVDSLRVNPNLELGLRVYGHQYIVQDQNCRDSRLEVPFSSGNHDEIIAAMNNIKPKGVTPIAYSLEQTAKDFPAKSGFRNIVILITDGLESCDGDPCQVSLVMQRANVFLKPFVIGLGMEQDYEDQFRCVGDFFDARDTKSFKKALNQAIATTLSKTTASLRVTDGSGETLKSGLNVTFVNNFTRQSAYNFVSYAGPRNKTDSVVIDGVISYDIRVNTIPPIDLKNYPIKAGTHNDIKVKAPTGTLVARVKGRAQPPENLIAWLKDPKSGRTLHHFAIGTPIKVLEGHYEVEINTIPRRQFRVRIEENQTEVIPIEIPGMLSIRHFSNGYGSLYETKPDGTQEWVMDFEENFTRASLSIQPGNYKLVFRMKLTEGIKYTIERDFEITSGATTEVKTF